MAKGMSAKRGEINKKGLPHWSIYGRSVGTRDLLLKHRLKLIVLFS